MTVLSSSWSVFQEVVALDAVRGVVVVTPLWTIGYEGFTSDEWLDSLVASGVQTVVDVREMPLSRKPGFSKSRLADALRARGIEYVHLRSLGNPKEYRHRLRNGWSFDEPGT